MNFDVIFLLKNNSFNDPVDRLRGRDIINGLNSIGVNAREYSEQLNPSILLSLRHDIFALSKLVYCKPEFFILDLQDDFFTKNKDALKFVQGERKRFLQRFVKILKKENLYSLFLFFLFRVLNKLARNYLVRKADVVITSSQSLKKIAQNYNPHVVCIPDSIDIDLYNVSAPNNYKKEGIAWIGTPHNIKYLLLVNHELKKVQELSNQRIKIISDLEVLDSKIYRDVIDSFEFDFELIDWEIDSFVDKLKCCAVGIAPLPNKISKSTNKILSYMACGLPVICSGSEDYRLLNDNNPNCFIFCPDHSKWVEEIVKLLKDENEMSKLSDSGKNLAKKHSLTSISKEYKKLFLSLRRYDS